MRFSIRTMSGDAPQSSRVQKVETPQIQEWTQEDFDHQMGVTSLRMMARCTPEMVEATREKGLIFWKDYGTNHRIEGGVYKRDLPPYVTYFVDLETLDDLRELVLEEECPIRLETDNTLLIADESEW